MMNRAISPLTIARPYWSRVGCRYADGIMIGNLDSTPDERLPAARVIDPNRQCTLPLRRCRMQSMLFVHADNGELTLISPESSDRTCQLEPVHCTDRPVSHSKLISPMSGTGLRVDDVHMRVRVPTYSSSRVTVTVLAPGKTRASASAISYTPVSPVDSTSVGTPPPGVPLLATARTVQSERSRRSTMRSMRVAPDTFADRAMVSPSGPDVHACPRRLPYTSARMLTDRPAPALTTAASAGLP